MHRNRNEAFHLHFSADLIPFTQEILKGKLNFLCTVDSDLLTEETHLVNNHIKHLLKAVVQRCSVKKVILEISLRGCVYDNWKPGFLPHLIFEQRTFLRRVTAHWSRGQAKKSSVDQSELEKEVVSDCKKNYMLNSQENTCASISFLIKLQASDCILIKKETLAQVFSCKFCEISKSNLF